MARAKEVTPAVQGGFYSTHLVTFSEDAKISSF